MVAFNHSQQLVYFYRSKQEQGILDSDFDLLETCRVEGNPLFLSEIIDFFIKDTDEKMEELTRFMSVETDDFNFSKIDQVAHNIKGCSASIGGCRVALACQEFHQACNHKSKEECLSIFRKVKQEYKILHDTLTQMRQMDKAKHGGGSSSSEN
ncbi:histidine-containing phosphotransfer protein 2-like [Cannabis sativa]|uniref:Histidine-containing phosphotransfer protein n=1 Tax=Cannabis sativa TaxID=3483 RepID=A0A7J6G8X5_CANSA|nr:histidine-containing phosphotransfer protein 2-like [Cannabis sativa]KAF4378549.1 hypothetical protein F8388_022370 [Cannabis sativa]KAF4400723.1 hypothetical protein G4B88_001278 [Cannabis sativa]